MKFLISFLVAVLISSIGFKKFIWFVSLGYGGARRLEIRQNKNYGSDSEYQKYVKRDPHPFAARSALQR